MNLKLTFCLISIVLLASCKREMASFQRSTYHGGSYTKSQPEIKEKEYVSITQNNSNKVESIQDKNQLIEKKSDQNKVKEIQKSISPLKALMQVKKEIRKENKTNKDRDPRFSRAMVMTIFGGIATLLGILAYSVAPTGLFIFIFGIIFLIGLVSLIMYLANPKPSM